MRKSISMPELYHSQIIPYKTEPISIPPKKKNTLSTKAISYDNVSLASAYTSYHNAFLCSTIIVSDDKIDENKDIDFAVCIATPPDIVDEHKDSEICSEEIKENARQHLRKMIRRKKKK